MRHFTLLQIINESGAETGDKKAYKKVDKCEIVYVSHDHFAGVVRVEKKKNFACELLGTNFRRQITHSLEVACGTARIITVFANRPVYKEAVKEGYDEKSL